MTGTALHTNKNFQCLVLHKIVIVFTANKYLIQVINMRTCNVLLNFFVSVHIHIIQFMFFVKWNAHFQTFLLVNTCQSGVITKCFSR